MNKKLVIAAFIALGLTGCATMTPEQREEFARNMALGMQAANQGRQQGQQQAQQNQPVYCTSNKIGDTVYTTCH